MDLKFVNRLRTIAGVFGILSVFLGNTSMWSICVMVYLATYVYSVGKIERKLFGGQNDEPKEEEKE